MTIFFGKGEETQNRKRKKIRKVSLRITKLLILKEGLRGEREQKRFFIFLCQVSFTAL